MSALALITKLFLLRRALGLGSGALKSFGFARLRDSPVSNGPFGGSFRLFELTLINSGSALVRCEGESNGLGRTFGSCCSNASMTVPRGCLAALRAFSLYRSCGVCVAALHDRCDAALNLLMADALDSRRCVPSPWPSLFAVIVRWRFAPLARRPNMLPTSL